ncbi:MAG: HAMP domain-containing protein [Spirochaetes bacterium]|nr:HAMP domain-containing protein [Spirochaetota bacterium]
MIGRKFSTSYYILDEIEEEGILYSMVVQQAGNARVADEGGDHEGSLYVDTFISLKESRNRIGFINQSILTISLIIAFFTALISLGLSKAVAEPIKRLRRAMLQLKAGEEPVHISGPKNGEIADLLQGFNEMTAQIALDGQALSEQIREITRIKDYNDKIFNSIQERILVINSVFIVEKVNRAFLDDVAMHEASVIGENIDELSINLFDELIHVNIRVIISGSISSVKQTRRAPSGLTFEIKFYPFLESSSPSEKRVQCIMIIEDVTRKVAYEDKLRQAEKLASISMLSAGVAHEINNPLGSILTNFQNLLKTERDPDILTGMQLIEQETKRIAWIVRNLLDFSSAGRRERNVSDINDVVEMLLRLVGYSIRRDSRI